MKAALYARVSTNDRGQNPEMQLDQLRKLCSDAGWEVFGEYVDQASADDFIRRKEWARLMKDASLHKFDVLLIWKLDRAFRSVIDGANTLGVLRAFNVKIKILQESYIDTTTPFGEVLFHISVAWAQLEKDLMKTRINAGLEYAKRHGTKSGKGFGRPHISIDLENVFKAFTDSGGNKSAAARSLSVQLGRKITAAHVFSWIKEYERAQGFKTEQAEIITLKRVKGVRTIATEDWVRDEPIC
jgi:DNA invertase Pin-like site-specific DNA recombinase